MIVNINNREMKTILRLTLLVLLAGGIATTAISQSAGAFARIGLGSRGMALRNASVADGFGDTPAFYNPALAPFVSTRGIEAGTGFLSLDRSLQFVHLATPLKPRAGIAVGLIRAGVSDIDGRDASGYHTQNYSTNELAFLLSFGIKMGEKMSAGLGFRLYRSDLLEGVKPASGIGLSLGVHYKLTPEIQLGLSLDDLLARYSWDTSEAFGTGAGKKTTDKFPTRLRFGAAWMITKYNTLVTAEYESQFAKSEHRTSVITTFLGLPHTSFAVEDLTLHSSSIRLGVESWLMEDKFGLRAGVENNGLDTFDDLSYGAGFSVKYGVGELQTQADYTFVLTPFQTSGMHLITLHLFI